MYQFLTKHGTSAAFGLGLVIAAVFLIIVMGGLGDFNALSKENQLTTGIFDFGIKAAILLVGLCVLIALVFGIYHLVTNPKGAIKLILGLGVLIGLMLVLTSIATPENSGPLYPVIQKFEITDGVSKFITGALGTALILSALAALTFVVSEVRNLFK